jgi:ribonuclease HIII
MKSTSIITSDGFDESAFSPVKVVTLTISKEKLQDLKVTGEIDSEILEIQEQIKKIIKEM